VSTRIAITAGHLQRDFASHRHHFDSRGLDVVLPERNGQNLNGQDLINAVQGATGVIAGDDGFTAHVLEALVPTLRSVSKWGIGLDAYDLPAAEDRGVIVTNTPGMFNDEVAEMALGYLIASVRDIVGNDGRVRAGEWTNRPGRTIAGKRVTVLGMGNIGLSFIKKALALDMVVTGVDPSPEAQVDARAMGAQCANLGEAIVDAEILVVLAPLNAATNGLVDAGCIEQMAPGSYLINVGRGPIVVGDAVADSLASGHLAGAALDVFEQEPLPALSRLRKFDNCILGSHNSSNTMEACHRTHEQAIANLFGSLGLD